MRSKEEMIAAVHRVFRTDPWVRQLFQSAGIGADMIADAVSDVYDNLFVDTATWGLDIIERDLGIVPSGSYEDRRSVIIAKYRTSETLTLATLQNIAESWENGNITVDFVDGKIKVTFASEKGIPTRLDDFKNAIENAKPAHLAVLYVVAYLTWAEAKNRFTWTQAHAYTWDDFRNQV